MQKYNLIIADPPYPFLDKLSMSKTKRGAKANYSTLSDQDIINLPVKDIAADDAILALWVPSSKLQVGLDCMKNWGFVQKQTWIWVKIKNNPLDLLKKQLKHYYKLYENYSWFSVKDIINDVSNFDVNNILNFKMGRLFRQTHEIVLIGTRGKIYKHLKNKSQVSVHLWRGLKHSEKPEELQNRLDKMFSDFMPSQKIELFSRRQRSNYLCLGNEAPMTEKEDIRKSLNKLQNISGNKLILLEKFIEEQNFKQLYEVWKKI